MSSFAIRAEKVSKFYSIEKRKKPRLLRDRIQNLISSGIKTLSTRPFGAKKRHNENIIAALDEVSFEIKQGESVGIIGSNGAGKTTLLKILSKITSPSEGRVRMFGRVGSLLEVGTGFHTELSGRENVYLNGAVLGMRKKEIDRKFDEIVAFSGVEEFIDTPVKHYSSGMRMRLAFSVAAHLDPEILLIDEVLAVGDVAFQNKSLKKMETVIRDGRTILFVSHNLAIVKSLCPQSIFLKDGVLKYMGDTETAVNMYLHNNELASQDEMIIHSLAKAKILNISTCDSKGNGLKTFPHDKPIYIRIKLYLNTAAPKTHLMLKVYNANLEVLFTSYDFEPDGKSLIPSAPGTYDFQIQVPANFLNPARYYLGAQLSRQSYRNKVRAVDNMEHVSEFEVYDNGSLLSQLNIQHQGQVHNHSIKWKCL